MKLTFGTFLKIILEYASVSQSEFAAMLIDDSISGYAPLNSSDLSNYANNKKKLPKYYLDYTKTSKGIKKTTDIFLKEIIPNHLDQSKIDELVDRLLRLITDRAGVNKFEQEKLIKMHSTNRHEFIAHVYLVALKKENVIEQDVSTSEDNWPKTKEFEGKLYLDGTEFQFPTQVGIHLSDDGQIKQFQIQLCIIYSEAEGVTITIENISQTRFIAHFDEQKTNYLKAEYVKRVVQDIFPPDNCPFEQLKEEIFYAIHSLLLLQHESGLKKLDEIVARVTAMNTTKSILTQLREWVGIGERIGVCHILVNEGRMKWEK